MTGFVFLLLIALSVSVGLNAAYMQQEWRKMRNQRAYWERKFAREAKRRHDVDMARRWINQYRGDNRDGE